MHGACNELYCWGVTNQASRRPATARKRRRRGVRVERGVSHATAIPTRSSLRKARPGGCLPPPQPPCDARVTPETNKCPPPPCSQGQHTKARAATAAALRKRQTQHAVIT